MQEINFLPICGIHESMPCKGCKDGEELDEQGFHRGKPYTGGAKGCITGICRRFHNQAAKRACRCGYKAKSINKPENSDAEKRD